MIESLRTTQIAFFRLATPSGFLRGTETRYKKYSCKSPCKGKSYETICENIVSRYQILVPSVPRGDRFSAQTTENRIYNWAAVKRGSPVNRFHVAMGLFSNRSQKTSIKCDKNIDTLACNPFDTSLFLPHFDVTCNLLLNRLTATWNLFVKWRL